jgi:hypothetical protein
MVVERDRGVQLMILAAAHSSPSIAAASAKMDERFDPIR